MNVEILKIFNLLKYNYEHGGRQKKLKKIS